MSDFKVGDRVEIVNLCEITDFKIGDIGTITKIDKDVFYNIQVTNEISFDSFNETEIKKIEGEKTKMNKLMNIDDMKSLTNNEYLIQETRKILELTNEVTDDDIVDILERMEYSDIEKFNMYVGAIMLGNPIKFDEFKYYESFNEWFKEVDTITILSELAKNGQDIDMAKLLPMEFVELSNGAIYVLDNDLRGIGMF